jgi:hypothetical protein
MRRKTMSDPSGRLLDEPALMKHRIEWTEILGMALQSDYPMPWDGLIEIASAVKDGKALAFRDKEGRILVVRAPRSWNEWAQVAEIVRKATA